MSRRELTAPFPWFGGKSAISDVVWKRLGNVTNYVEPFFGSGAVLLARPQVGKTETINDKDHFVANFWRAVQRNPDAVAHYADWPVNETDLHARHWWLLTEGATRLKEIEGDPDLFDEQVAGWWVWGACAWIGSGWCSGRGPWLWGASGWGKIGVAEGNAGMGINRQLPHLGNAGRGINRQLPHLGDAGRGQFIFEWMTELSLRLREVRVCAGDWSRVCGPSVTHRHGVTGVFLDPPYADTASRTYGLYSTDDMTVAHDVRKWAISEAKNPQMRIVLAGYDGEHDMPPDWEVVEWKARGGFGSQDNDEDGTGRVNSQRERLWFSPACVKPHRDKSLLDLLEVAE